MDNTTMAHILQARYVIKGLSNLERMKIIAMLRDGEMSAAAITMGLKVGSRETLRHLTYLIEIEVVRKKRVHVHLRTYKYSLDLTKIEHYLSCIGRMVA